MVTTMTEKRRRLYEEVALAVAVAPTHQRPRFYNPAVARFTEMDSFMGDVQSPLTLHKYLYCNNDGINLHDPTGHEGDLISTMIATTISVSMQTIRLVGSMAVRAYVWRTVQNVAFGSLLGAAFGGAIAASDPQGDVAEGMLAGAKWGAIFGAVPPFV